MPVDTKTGSDATPVVIEEEKYQTAPNPQLMFKPLKARAMVEAMLQAQLADVEYDPVTTPTLTSTLAVDVKNALRSLNLPRYKYMVQVVITENKGAGMRMGARCLWDAKTDSATEAIFLNNSIVCCRLMEDIDAYCRDV